MKKDSLSAADVRKNSMLLRMVEEVEDYAILLINTEGYIENWNKGAEKIKGYKAEEAIGKNFRMFYTETDRINLKPDGLIEIAKLNGKATDEGWRIRKDGTRFWGSITITAIHDDKGNVLGFTKVTRDLTERMVAENAIKQNLRELEIKNKELEQFVYIASHDLQEPLLTVTNFVELLQSEYAGKMDEDANMYLNFITQASERMRNLVKGLLDYSRIGRKKVLVEVDCNKLLDTIQQDLGNAVAAANANINYHGLPTVWGYETELRQLFQNLISNAIKFAKKDVSPEITISSQKIEKAWEFAVADNGIGIDPQYKDKIFLIFQRLHNRSEYEGNGIGLAHCKKIIDLHGGDIWVNAEPGRGSTFYFTIPIKGEEDENEKI